MRFKAFSKPFLICLAFQIGLLMVVSPLLSRLLTNGKVLPQFLIQVVYNPFIHLAISAGGYKGESAMIWPPVFGIILGLFVYSTLFALIFVVFLRKSNPSGRDQLRKDLK